MLLPKLLVLMYFLIYSMIYANKMCAEQIKTFTLNCMISEMCLREHMDRGLKSRLRVRVLD